MVEVTHVKVLPWPEDHIVRTHQPTLRAYADRALERAHSIEDDIAGLAKLIVPQVLGARKIICQG